jgi:phosphatidate cytidylyltransferase
MAKESGVLALAAEGRFSRMAVGLFNHQLLLRVISALALLPVVLVAVWYGDFWFRLLLAVAFALMLYEWLQLLGVSRGWFRPVVMILYAGFGGAFLYFPLGLVDEMAAFFVSGSISALGILGVASGQTRVFWTLTGLVYIATPILSLLWISTAPFGMFWIYWCLLTVWAMDVGGFFVGKTIGRHKLAPYLSPNKTWEGLAGGILLAIIADWILYKVLATVTIMPLPEIAPAWYLAAFMAAFAQVGDLFESGVKRHFGIKDTSGLIPGHGGLLDRVDGLLFVAPALALWMIL